MSKEIFVAFATQKGGIGKSTVTALAASYLHNVKGYNVAVVDCDDPQHSIHGLREHEMGLIDSSTYFKALACDHFRRIKKNDLHHRQKQCGERPRRCREDDCH